MKSHVKCDLHGRFHDLAADGQQVTCVGEKIAGKVFCMVTADFAKESGISASKHSYGPLGNELAEGLGRRTNRTISAFERIP